MEQICGNCKYHQFENIDQGWVCVNDQSEYLTDWTDYNDSCEEWTAKNDER